MSVYRRSLHCLLLASLFLLAVVLPEAGFRAAEVAGPEPFCFGEPAVGRNADGRLEVFHVGSDGSLRHCWQKEPEGEWSLWSSLGGTLRPGLAAATDSGGKLVVFAADRSHHTLRYIRQLAPNGHQWSEWEDLGVKIQGPVSVAPNADGRLEVFAVEEGTRAAIHAWQTNGAGGWSAWHALGLAVEPGLAVAPDRGGRLELFAVSAESHSMMHCRQISSNRMEDWSDWNDLGGDFMPGVAVGHTKAGALEVYGVARQTGAVQYSFQVFGAAGVDWVSWINMGTSVKPGLSVENNADGRLEIFARDSTNGVACHNYQRQPGGGRNWMNWLGMEREFITCPAVGRNRDGNLEIFGVSQNDWDLVQHRRQIGGNNDWLDWLDIDYATPQYSSRVWQTSEGLPHDEVLAVAQTRDGYLWVGTRDGLARFDGLRFTVFDSQNCPELRDSFVTALCVDRSGTLWIGTDAGGLVCLRTNVFSRCGAADGLAGDHVRTIYESKDGSIWIGTTTGMSRYRDHRFVNYTRREGLLSDVVRSIYEDRLGNIWIATPKGLNCWNGRTMNSFTGTNGLPNNSVRGIWQDRGGRFWVGSDSGMVWTGGGGQKFYVYNTTYGLSDSFVTAIYEDSLGNLWVGTHSGLNRFRECRFFTEFNDEGLPYDVVNTIFEDREGTLWIGSSEGLIRLTPKKFYAWNRKRGLSHNNVMSVLEDRTGNIWLGTWGGGLNQMNGDLVAAWLATNSFPHDLVTALGEGRDGSLWAGLDADGGLVHLQNGKITRYTKADGLGTAIRVLHEDRSGALWVGTSEGLSRLSNGKFTNYTIRDGLGGGVRALLEDEGGLWIGTENGLSRWENGVFKTYRKEDGLSGNSINALYRDGDGNLWVGTLGGGLNRFKDGRWVAYTAQQGLFSDEIFEILEDNNGWLWMSCSKGIFRVSRSELINHNPDSKVPISCVAYGKTDGLDSTQCNGSAKPAGWKTRDGRLLFPTTKGLISFKPDSLRTGKHSPPVFIEKIVVDKRWVIVRGPAAQDSNPGARPIQWPDEPDAPIEIPPGRGELEFYFTALNFQAPEKSRLKYKLEKMDSDWVDAETRRSVRYNNVYPGTYRFQVIACGDDGVWNPTGPSVVLRVLPHFWQSWWFRILAVLGTAGSMGMVGRYATKRRMQLKLELLQHQHAVEKERARIAKDIHDDLGSRLTQIMMLGERVEEDISRREEVGLHLRKIVNSARDTVQSLDEIVWAVNPENDTLDSLVVYISHYANEFFEDTDLRCRLEMPVDLRAVSISAEDRHDLFLVVKEVFNNIAKHARASEVRVRVTEADSLLEIVITDDGCGFDPKEAEAGRKGEGLRNMRRRVQGLGGQFEVTSAAGSGTRVRFTVKLSGRPELR